MAVQVLEQEGKTFKHQVQILEVEPKPYKPRILEKFETHQHSPSLSPQNH
jgi:hypothetical protein